MFLRKCFLTKTTLYLLYSQYVKVPFKFLIMHYLQEIKKCFINASNGQKVVEESTSRQEYQTSSTSDAYIRRRAASLKNLFQFFRMSGTSDACIRKQTESLNAYLNSFGCPVMEFFVCLKSGREFERLFQLFRTSGDDVLRLI